MSTVEQILKRKGSNVVAVTPDKSLVEVAQALKEHRIGAVLVRRADGPMQGILSERDIIVAIAKEGPAALGRTAADIMTTTVVTCAPEDGVNVVMAQLTNKRFRHLPVVKDGELVGIVSIGDLVKQRIETIENEAQAMREYIQHT